MTQEEKAKRYDEVFEIAKEIHNEHKAQCADVMTKIFPELKESEDEKIRKALIAYFDDANKADENPLQSYGIHTDKAITWLEKQCEQNPAWSEEDEDVLEDVEEAIINYWHGQSQEDLLDWLKALKDRVQPKQEWSDEDNEHIKSIISTIECSKAQFPNSPAVLEAYNSDLIWLKSLRPQNTWKPSEGQLECLGYAIEKAEKDWSPLTNNRIYLTLKALKEQLERL